jgi:amino acid transporter
MLGWIAYSYIFSKLIYSFAKRYFNINISFSRTWVITSLSGISSFIIFIFTIITFLIFLPFSYYIDTTIIILEIFTAILVVVFITSLIAYKFLSNVNLRVAIFMSFATFLAYIIFIIIALYLYNILFPPPQICCALHYIK